MLDLYGEIYNIMFKSIDFWEFKVIKHINFSETEVFDC